MAVIWENEPDTSTVGNIPVGLYYYYIKKNEVDEMKYLGYVPTITSLSYNPFIDKDDLTLFGNNFDVDRYGKPDNVIPKCYRIATNPTIEKELADMKLFPYRIEYAQDYESKMFVYPFRYFLITDYINPPLLIKPELVKTDNNSLVVKVITSPLSMESKYNIFVEGYKNDMFGNLEGIINNTSLMLPVASSMYSNFLATSSNSFNKGIENALLENDMSLRHGNENFRFNQSRALANGVMGTISSGLGTIGSAMSGNPFGVVSGINGGVSGLVNMGYDLQGNRIANSQMQEGASFKEYDINSMAQAKISDMLSTPKSLKTCGNDTLFNLTNSKQKIDVIEYRMSSVYQQRVEEYFKRYGYSINTYRPINITSRKYFNFIKTHVANIRSNTVPQIHLDEVKSIFNSGITFWHVENGAEIGNYNVVNREVKF